MGRLHGSREGPDRREKTMKRYEQAISLLLLCIMAGFIVWGLHAINKKSEPSSIVLPVPDSAIIAEQ